MKQTDTYEQICEANIDAMYRVAYLAIGDTDAAVQTVQETCVACIRTCERIREKAEIQRCLFADLSRRCEQKLSFCKWNDSALPKQLRDIDPRKRLRLALQIAAEQG